jgi:hypothetical protein
MRESIDPFAGWWFVPDELAWAPQIPEGVTREWLLSGGGGGGRTYNPLDESMLFMVFAQIPLDVDEGQQREAMQRFACEYGLLGIGAGDWDRPGWGQSTGEGVATRAESFRDWQREVEGMRRAVDLWTHTRDRDANALAQYIRWHQSQSASTSQGQVQLPAGWYYLEQTGKPGGPISVPIEPGKQPFAKDDIFAPASFVLANLVDHRTRQYTAVALHYDRAAGGLRIKIIAQKLLGALWLQLAQAIDGNRQPRACRDCGKWFEISAEEDGRSARRLFCSEACKARDYRRRRDSARQMNAEGKSPKRIAQELDTNLETVKKWIAKRKG